MPKERIDRLNDCNSFIVFCLNNVVVLIYEDKRHFLILQDSGPRCKKLTPNILKYIANKWSEIAIVSKIPLIFTEQNKIEDTIIKFMEYYPGSSVKWYYTVSL